MSNTKKCPKGQTVNPKTGKCKKINRKFTVKQKARLENSESRKTDKQILDDYIKAYSKDAWSSLRLINESKLILTQLDKGKSANNTQGDLELQYEALTNVMEKRLLDNYIYTNTFKGYPDYEDPEFNEKISSKKEFYINKIPKRERLDDDALEVTRNKLCNPLYNVDESEKGDVEFNLTHNQKFLKSFLSPNTPFNSMLLFHGTGVGKTCTSISIAEQYTDQLKAEGKKIIILLNPSIKANFIKNIFNIEKVKSGMPYYQCTGDKYLEDFEKMPLHLLKDKINKIIKGRYEFYGYQKFANILETIQRNVRDRYEPKDHNRMINKKIKETFSNTVMIIDEVHNIKEGADLKVLPPLLEKVVSLAVNMKLLLLSATPMFDNSREIIFLINLMLRNNKKPIIHANDYIDKDGNIKPGMREMFIYKTKGLISYMRGEDPYRFPERLYPKDVIKFADMPKLDKDGKSIKLRIKDLQIVPCVMKGMQTQLYDKMENADEKYGAFNQAGVMCSNIVFPKKDIDPTDDEYNFNTFISNDGFNGIIKKEKIGGHLKYSIKHPEFEGFFDLKNIINYSAKIAKIIKNIDKSKGIVFIYSQYINAGIVPLALALEYAGYSKYGNSLIKDSISPTKGNYIIISGNNDLSANAYSEYIKLQDSNKNGEKIKIILGSETAAEGLDFSYIREVHILDPWFHLNKIEQVIGRGIRNCSHIDLASEDRDVTIYLYAAVKSIKPINDNETVDLEIYRKAELKSVQMAEIEYLLKTSSVDCYLNMHGNKFNNDIDNSKKCNYKKCDYKCTYDLPDEIDGLNTDTFNLYESMISDNIYEVKRQIIKLFKQNNYYGLDDFISILGVESLLIYFALNDIIDNRVKIINKNGKVGTIIYKNGIYVFISKNSSRFLSINNLRHKNTKKRIGSFNISRNNVLSKLSKNNKSSKIRFKFDKTIDKEIEDILENVKIILDEFPKKNSILSDILDIKMTADILDMINKLNKYYIDFMDVNDKEKLTKYLIYKSLTSKLNKLEKTIASTLSTILYFKNDVYFEDILYKGPEKIWGYKKINGKKLEYRRYDDRENKFVPATDEEIKQIYKSFKKKIKTIPKSANIIGYYELRPNQTIPDFKIRDKTYKVTKGSHIKTGSVCNNDGMKKAKIVSYINTIKPLTGVETIGNYIGGTGYAINDSGTLEGGDGKTCIYTVTTVNAGVPTLITINKPGMKYKVGEVLTLKGAGNGLATVTVLTVTKIFSNKKSTTWPGKIALCKYLELILRHKDITDDSHRHFYGPEETIEYKLNEKA
jgi:hypothetical protein